MAESFDFYIRGKADLVRAVERFGFVPFFKNRILGFSIAEHCAPETWFSDEEGIWEWKGPVVRETGCAYGKFFENKAVFISREWFPDFANYRRNGYDFDALWEDGKARHADKALYDLLSTHAPVTSRALKDLGGYGREGRRGFDASISRLQALGYVLISDFVYDLDRKGNPYGWGVAEYSTPERWLDVDFTQNVYRRSPEESFERILTHLKTILPFADEAALRRILK